MPKDIAPEKIPVVLLYNVDPEWTKEEKNEVIRQSNELGDALQKAGYPTVTVAIEDDDIAAHLIPSMPKYIIFNWCEDLPGIEHSEWLVAKKLEMLGYTFTGADSVALSLADDKQRVKALMDKASIPTPAWRICNSSDVKDWKIFPAIVKPQNEHCSAGITPESVVMNIMDLKNRISFILDKYSQPALVEDFIDGRSFTSRSGATKKLLCCRRQKWIFPVSATKKTGSALTRRNSFPGPSTMKKLKHCFPLLSPKMKKKPWKRYAATLIGQPDAGIMPEWT